MKFIAAAGGVGGPGRAGPMVEGLEPRIALSASAYQGAAVAVNRYALTPPTTSFNGELVVAGTGGLSRWDGDAAGAPAAFAAGQGAFNWNGALYFSSTGPTNKLYRLDAGRAAPVELTAGGGATSLSNASAFVPAGAKLYFAANGSVCVTDGTSANTQVLHSGTPLAVAGGRLFFKDYAASGGVSQLWVTDGTAAGTAKVKDAEVYNGAELNGKFIFGNQNGLWSSNGTAAGTTLITSSFLPRGNVDIRHVGNYVYLVTAITDGLMLHRTDGTAAGTVLIKSGLVLPGSDGTPYVTPAIATLNDTVFFIAYDAASNAQVYATVGTTTRQVTNFSYASKYFGAMPGLAQAGGKVFFAASSPAGAQFWMTDGQAGSYQAVPGAQGGDYAAYLTASGGSLYFVHNGAVARFAVQPAALEADGTLVVSGTDPAEGGNGADAIAVSISGGNVVAVVNGQTYAYPAASVLRLTINAMGGADAITVAPEVYGPVGAAPRLVTVNAGAGGDAFAVEGTAGADVITIDADGVQAGGGAALRAVVRGAGELIVRGNGGADQISVAATAWPKLTLDGGAGDDRVTVGAGTLQAIAGAVTVTGGGGSDALTIDDSLNADIVSTAAVNDGPISLRGDAYALSGAALVRTRTADRSTQTFTFNGFGGGGVRLLAGGAPNLITVTPDAATPLSVAAGDPKSLSPTRLGDALEIAPGAPAGGTLTRGAAGAGTFAFPGRHDVTFTGVEVADDLAAPAVVTPRLVTSAPPHRLTFRFGEPVAGAPVAAGLTLTNLTTGRVVPAAVMPGAYNTISNTVTFTFIGGSKGLLPAGDYRATIPGAAIKDLSGRTGADFTYDFTVTPAMAAGADGAAAPPQAGGAAAGPTAAARPTAAGATGGTPSAPAPAPAAPAAPAAFTGIALDLTFGTGGKVVTDLTPGPGISDDAVADSAVTADGKIVSVGSTPDYSLADLAVVRYLPDGGLDPAFGTGGLARYRDGANDTRAVACYPLASGKLLVAGWSKFRYGSIWTPRLILARFDVNGALDPTFGTNGVTVVDNGEAQSMTVQAGGKILVSGHIEYGGYSAFAAIWRFDANGAADASFGTNGRVTYDQKAYYQGIGGLTPLPLGKFLGGTAGGGGLARFNADGTVDTTFGANGYAGVGGPYDLDAAGRIVVAAPTGTNSAGYAVRVVRLTANGAPDPTFGANGQTILSWGGINNFASDVAVQGDGRIIVGATSRDDVTYEDFCLARLSPDGAPDLTFGSGGGKFVQAFADTAYAGYADHLGELLLLPGGRLLAVGGTTVRAAEDQANINAGDNLALVRFALDAPIDVATGGPYGPVDEGSAFAVSAAGTSYAGGAVVSYEWDLAYNGRTFTADATGPAATLTAGDDALVTVALRVTTADGLQAIETTTVDVRNVAPTADAGPDRRAAVGGIIAVATRATDVVPESLGLTVDWGDGTAPSLYVNSSLRTSLVNSFAHAYAARGLYTVTVTASDGDGGTSTDTAQVRVGSILATVYIDADGGGSASADEARRAGHGVFLDLDRDGRRDPGEPDAVTDARGEALFDDLPPDEYTVRADPLPGYAFNVPANGTWDVTTWDEGGATVAFGLTQLASIAGAAYEDANGNGAWDPGELPLAGRTVSLQSYAGAGATTSLVATTNAYGTYRFIGLAPGTYLLRSTGPAGWAQTAAGRGLAAAVTVAAAENAAGVDFGQAQGAAEVYGVVFRDDNGDGARGAGEGPIANRVVYVDANDNGVRDPAERAATVAGDGAYAFKNLPPGTYAIRLVPRGGWQQTGPAAGAAHTVTLAAGAVLTGKDFGVRKVDVTAPAVTGMTFAMDAHAAPIITVDFSEAMGPIGSAALSVQNVGTGATTGSSAAYDAATHRATFRPTAALPEGNYVATFYAETAEDEAGNLIGGPTTLAFTVLSGDADMNGVVNFADLVPLAQNYNTFGGRTWAQGDFTGDGNVDFGDLVMLAQRYNVDMSGAATAATAATTPVAAASFAQAWALATAPPAAPVKPTVVPPTPIRKPAPPTKPVAPPKPVAAPKPAPPKKPAIAPPARPPASPFGTARVTAKSSDAKVWA